MSIWAVVIITGFAADSLGCPPNSRAQERQTWIAQAVREPWANQTLYNLLPGQPFSFNFTVSQPDTYSVRLWGRNSAGDGCQSVVVASGMTIVAVPDPGVVRKKRAPRGRFDLQGRRIRSARLRSGWYSDTVVVR